MRDYRLYELTHTQFEDFIVRICVKILGQGVVHYAKIKDAGCDAAFTGTATSFPSTTEPLRGKFVIQSKHSSKRDRACSDSDFMRAISDETPKIAELVAAGKCDHYILFTNRTCTVRAAEKISAIITAVGVVTVWVIGQERISTYIESFPDIHLWMRAIKDDPWNAYYDTLRLRINVIEPMASNRFVYNARVTPFIGRLDETRLLKDFLETDENFSWMLVHGPGGTGKSRFALESCISLSDQWHAGFLSFADPTPDWSRWQPTKPTFIVVDYASRHAEKISDLFDRLAARENGAGPFCLFAKVRILLIERVETGDWLQTIIGTGSKKALISSARSHNLHLGELEDIWEVIQSHIGQGVVTSREKSVL